VFLEDQGLNKLFSVKHLGSGQYGVPDLLPWVVLLRVSSHGKVENVVTPVAHFNNILLIATC